MAQIVSKEGQKKDPSGRISKAHEVILNLVSLRADFPKRWSAYQIRETTDTGQLDSLRVYEERIEELVVCDDEAQSCYTRVWDRSRKSTPTELAEGLPMAIQTFSSPQKKLHKIEGELWQSVKVMPNIGYPYTDPLNWCCGFINSAKSGLLGRDDYLEKLFFSSNGECIFARENGKRLLVGYWIRQINPKPPQQFVVIVTSDIKTGQIQEYSGAFVPEGMTAEQAIQKNRLDVVETGRVSWRQFRLRDSERSWTLELPIKVHILSTMNTGEQKECNNRISWLFQNDLLDASFVSPDEKSFREPDLIKFVPNMNSIDE